MTEQIPDTSNFYCSLGTRWSVRKVAALFRKAGWEVFVAYDRTAREAISDWAELVIESSSPVLVHGPVADVEKNADRILDILVRAGHVSAECYDPEGKLLVELSRPQDETKLR